MSMKYLKVFYDWPETTQYLKPAQKGELIDALVRYARGEADAESSLKGAALALFPSFKRQIDSDADAYASQTERNRENGKKGGRPRKEPTETQENPLGFSETQENPLGFSETQENPLGFSETQEKPRQRIKTKTKNKDKDNTTVTTVTSLPSLPSSLKKIDDNYKHSNRARAAAAQIVVDEIVNAGLPSAQFKNLFDLIFECLGDGYHPEQIFDCARQSTYPGELVPLLMNAKKRQMEQMK